MNDRTTLQTRLQIITVSLAFTGALTLFASLHAFLWLTELFVSQLPLLYLLTCAVLFCAVFLLFTQQQKRIPRRYIYMMLATVFLLITIPLQLHRTPSQLSPPAATQSLTYAIYNKLAGNRDLESAAQHLHNIGADIVSFQEITADELETYKTRLGLKYSDITSGKVSAFSSEIGVLSRYPIAQSHPIQVGENTVLRTVIQPDTNHKIAIYTVHILPPFYPAQYDRGRESFQQLLDMLLNESMPVLIGGDFNTVVYSPKMRSFTRELSQNNIRNSTTGLKPECSWSLQNISFLCMRIDHIFYSDNSLSLVAQPIIGPNTGSDHRTVSAQFNY